MFERFTDPARQAVAQAQDEARELGHDRIGPEHLLLGVLGVDPSAGGRVLTGLGVTLPAARAAVGEHAEPGRAELAAGAAIPFTPAAKDVLELALRESLTRGGPTIGTGHLLLAVLRDPGPAVRAVLATGPAGVDQVRAAVEPMPGDEPGGGVGLRLAPSERALASTLQRIEARLAEVAERLARIEDRLPPVP